MAFEYYSENHDWDMTLRAAWKLVMAAQATAKQDAELSFSCFAGSMLLSFCAVESFFNSVAFKMGHDTKHASFSYSKYTKHRGIWEKVKMVCGEAGVVCDPLVPPFSVLEEMRVWRTSIVHSKPYSVDPTTIDEASESTNLHAEFRSQEYTRSVNVDYAKSFYGCAYDITDLIIKATGIDPRAMCSYKVLDQN